MASAFFALLILSCAKDEKQVIPLEALNSETHSRSTECGPNPNQTGCTTNNYSGTFPTFMGCDAVATYSVQVCKTTSVPIKVTSIAIYNVDLDYSVNCTTLVDSIEYYLTHNNAARATYLINMFNRLATQNIEAYELDKELDPNSGNYDCDEDALVNLEFFSSKCYKFCSASKKQVFCGFGCCKRATGYCYKDGVLQSSVTNISQSSPCESRNEPCEVYSECSASACDIIIPVILDDNSK